LRFPSLVLAAAFAAGSASLPAIAQQAEPAAKAEAPPLTAYGRLPDIEDAALSPDGTRLALLTTGSNGKRGIILMTTALEPLRVFDVGDNKVRRVAWGNDRNLIVQVTSTQRLFGFNVDKYEFTSTLIVPADRGKAASAVFGNRQNLVNATFGNYGLRQVEGRSYAYFGAIELMRAGAEYTYEHGRPSLFRVDIDTNKPEKVEDASGDNVWRDWLVGRDGRVAARLDLDRESGRWRLQSGGRPIASGEAASGAVSLIALGKDGATAIYSTRDADNVDQWYEVPLAGGTPAPFFPDVDIERLYIDQQSGQILGFQAKGGKGEPRLFNPAHQDAIAKIRRAFAKYEMQFIDFTPDLKRAVVRISGNGDSGSWFIVDIATLRAQAIGYERDEILPSQVGAISIVDYKAADGTALSGILTLPPGREAKGLPVVMLPHGGPHAQDRAEFDWWAQAFASRGYAVFQPNFRGSTNRDDAFRRAGYGEWGGKMQSDVSDGLAALAAKGVVDPKRACIAGASYGGYAALAGVTLQQGLHRCAVSVNGVSDLGDLYQEDYRGSGEAPVSKRALLEQLGPRHIWPSRSPRRQAAKADAPVLLIHGKDDTVVPYSHTSRMADALKDAGKPVEVVTLAGEDHWLSRAATRGQMLSEAVAFVEKHNPPR
jgi:dipeptidyl aminopeptidase/acylaminoacyl peptidase